MKKRDIIIVIVVLILGLTYNFFKSEKVNLLEFFSIKSYEIIDEHQPHYFPVDQIIDKNLYYVLIQNPAGRIIINNSQDNTTIIKPRLVIFHQEKKRAESIRKKIQVSSSIKNKKLAIEIHAQGKFPLRRARILFEVFLPKGIRAEFSNKFGDIVAKNIFGDLIIKNLYGNISLSDIKGDIELSALNAKTIDIKDITSLQIKCRSSKVSITNVEKEATIQYAFLSKISAENCNGFSIEGAQNQIRLKKINHNLKIKNTHEDIFVQDCSADISINARDCAIKLNRIHAPLFILKNSYKNVSIKEYSGEQFDAVIAHAGLELDIKKGMERINIKGKHSNIIIKFDATLEPFFSLNNAYGKIVNKTPLNMNILKQKHALSAFTNQGSPQIIINNSYGDIVLKNRN